MFLPEQMNSCDFGEIHLGFWAPLLVLLNILEILLVLVKIVE